MAGRSKLYRLLRDDEDPLDEGIKAKLPYEGKTPLEHIRHGSRQDSQWISTSRNLSDVDELIRYKRRTKGQSRKCRVVEIDEQILKMWTKKSKDIMQHLVELMMETTVTKQSKMKLFTRIFEETTGKILDFTDQTVMNKHIPFDPSRPHHENEKARGYAKKYSEVLVERYIPSYCCIRVYDR